MNPNFLTLIFPVIIGLVILVVVLVSYKRKRNRTRRSLQELIQTTDGTAVQKSATQGDFLEGHHEGVVYACRFFSGSKNNPPSLTIRMRIPSPAKLTIRREAWYDRFARRIGLVAELQTGDPAFDQAYFLDTDRADIMLLSFSEEGRRRAVDTIFGMDYPVREIVFGKDDLRLVLAPFPEADLATFPLKQYLAELQKLSVNPSSAGYAASLDPRLFPGNPLRPLNKTGLVMLFVFNACLILGGIIALAYGMSEHEPMGYRLVVNALYLSIPAALFYLILVFRWIRGRSSSHRYYLIILILSLIGFPLGLTGGALVTNGILDQGPETSHRVSVSKLYDQQHKNSRTYYVAFPSWQEPGKEDRLSIPLSFYRSLSPGDEIIIGTKPGYWQEEWITGIQPGAEPGRKRDASGGFPLVLKSIRFYEGGAVRVPEKEKHFATEFPRETSRYIYCQINVENNYWNIKEQAYTFDWHYINPDGSIRGKVSTPFTVRKDWYRAWVSHSWGWKDPGNWPAGSYRVAVLVNGRPFGEGRFVIR